jgi:hypothetical protein
MANFDFTEKTEQTIAAASRLAKEYANAQSKAKTEAESPY